MSIHYKNKREQTSQDVGTVNIENKEKEKLILDLENSNSFKQTHSIIAQLKNYASWTVKEIEQLEKIAQKNIQVSYIINDEDIKEFYDSIK